MYIRCVMERSDYKRAYRFNRVHWFGIKVQMLVVITCAWWLLSSTKLAGVGLPLFQLLYRWLWAQPMYLERVARLSKSMGVLDSAAFRPREV